ncbi:MAG: hypothetical protein H6738_21100 [Alphaproteobacteria bacterium]|nr:hypothetical protein [Alphaproteobacteria bacterium]MCB9699292.1 hypothetical protein [Alphaproteobacteria bacterium]
MDDRELTSSLAALGLDRTNWRAVSLLPLVEVAWADGRVQKAERDLLVEVARRRGFEPGAAFLERWMRRRPPKATFLAARTLLMHLWARAGQTEAPQPQTLDELLDLCQQVAESAGGLFGLAFTVSRSEREAMEEIASSLRLGPALPDVAAATWSNDDPTDIRSVAPAVRSLAPAPPPAPASDIDHDATTRVLPRKKPLTRVGDDPVDDTTRIRPAGRLAPPPAADDWDEELDVTTPYADFSGSLAPGIDDDEDDD